MVQVLVVANNSERPLNGSEQSTIKVKAYSYLFWVIIYWHRKLTWPSWRNCPHRERRWENGGKTVLSVLFHFTL